MRKNFLFIFSLIISTLFSCKSVGKNKKIGKIDNGPLNKDSTIENLDENIDSGINSDKDNSDLSDKVMNGLNTGSDYNEEFIETDICEIHNRKMFKENIRIYYGLIKLGENAMKYYELRAKYFPNSNDSVNGGCVVRDRRYSEKYICEECNNQRDKYKNILGLK
jgi:hypothetical protein